MVEATTVMAGCSDITMQELAGQLRWVPKSMMQAADLKLQQAWCITTYRDCRPLTQTIEWRDVPIELNPAA